jgi:hypothetical protein
MPWYYAGPEAKPVGPVSVEELHACLVRGAISPETYVIEQKGQPGETVAWKRYREVFPTSPSLPPVPTLLPPPPPPSVTAPPAPPPVMAPPVGSPHPLFPSAAPVPGQQSVFTPSHRPDPYYQNIRPTNAFCAWGFWLGLASFLLAFACGLGVFPALIAILLCIIGLAQVHSHREQGGQYQAIWGLILSFIALVLAAIMIYFVDVRMIKEHELTVTEQTSNDSE